MVKRLKVKVQEEIKFEKNEVETEIEEYLSSLSESNFMDCILLLKEYYKTKKSCKHIKNAYVVLFVSFYILEQIPTKENLIRSKTLCRQTLSEIFEIDCKGKSLTPKSTHYQATQSVLNLSASFIASNPDFLKTNTKLLYFVQMLNLFGYFSFKATMQIFLRILETESHSSIFSLFTNKVTPFLPAKQKFSLTIVLDLDETLGFFEGKKFISRPSVDNFLDLLSKKYELVLFTSAIESYANYAMSIVDKSNLVKLRLYRQHLHIIEGKPYKDLTYLGRDLNKVIIIDNEPRNFALQPLNGINIITWKGDESDKELFKLMNIFERLQSEGKIAEDIVQEVRNLMTISN